MTKTLLAVVGLMSLAAIGGTTAAAAPLNVAPPATDGAGLMLVHNGPHRGCELGPGGWHYINRFGDRIGCRPRRPLGFYWGWRTEGERSGWYHSRDRRWR
jgi:hypothetical protein